MTFKNKSFSPPVWKNLAQILGPRSFLQAAKRSDFHYSMSKRSWGLLKGSMLTKPSANFVADEDCHVAVPKGAPEVKVTAIKEFHK